MIEDMMLLCLALVVGCTLIAIYGIIEHIDAKMREQRDYYSTVQRLHRQRLKRYIRNKEHA